MSIKVGDKVRIKEDLSKCEFGYNCYMNAYKGKKAIVVKVCSEGKIELDIDEQVWNWSENVLELIEEGKTMKMKRIDYILNAKDNIQTILDETILDCNICPSSCEDCNGNCEFYYKKYLNEEIEVDKSKLKDADVESITIGQALQSIYDIPPQIKINSDKIKEVNVDDENDNMNTKIEKRDRVDESDLKDAEISKEIEEKKGVEDKKNCKDCDYFVKSSLGNYCDFYGILLNIMHGCNEFQLKKHKEGIEDIKTENDPVNHPSHYTDGNIEVMDYIEDKGFNFALGNAVKYISRAGRKDKNKTIEDLEKSRWYLNREIERLKKLQDKNNE